MNHAAESSNAARSNAIAWWSRFSLNGRLLYGREDLYCNDRGCLPDANETMPIDRVYPVRQWILRFPGRKTELAKVTVGTTKTSKTAKPYAATTFAVLEVFAVLGRDTKASQEPTSFLEKTPDRRSVRTDSYEYR
jgi:hypothetical protein